MKLYNEFQRVWAQAGRHRKTARAQPPLHQWWVNHKNSLPEIWKEALREKPFVVTRLYREALMRWMKDHYPHGRNAVLVIQNEELRGLRMPPEPWGNLRANSPNKFWNLEFPPNIGTKSVPNVQHVRTLNKEFILEMESNKFIQNFNKFLGSQGAGPSVGNKRAREPSPGPPMKARRVMKRLESWVASHPKPAPKRPHKPPAPTKGKEKISQWKNRGSAAAARAAALSLSAARRNKIHQRRVNKFIPWKP